VGKKRPLTKASGTPSKKRLKVSQTQLPLTTIILATLGNNEGKMPELVFSRFYDCTREAKIGRQTYSLRININRKDGEREHQDEDFKSERVSIPVPLTHIEGVSVLSGMNAGEELLKAYSDGIALQASIKNWKKVIAKRTELHAKKQTVLEDLPEIEDKPKSESEIEQDAEQEKELEAQEVNGDDALDVKDEEGNIPENEESLKLADIKKEEKEKRKKEKLKSLKRRELAIKKRKLTEASIAKLVEGIQKAKDNLAKQEQKLEDIATNYGQQLAYFKDDVEGGEALRHFQNELTEGVEDNTGTEEDVAVHTDLEMQEGQAQESMENDDEEESEKAESAEVAENTTAEKNSASGLNQEPDESTNAKVDSIISDTPVWISILLKKPLEKFFASSSNNSICKKDVLDKVSLILLKYSPKHKNKIVLKNVTYEGTEEHLKHLNEVVEGPWKDIRKSPSKFLKDKTNFTLEKTVRYLAKVHQRQEVLDNTIDSCTLCEKTIKRMFMEKHLKQFCHKRQEVCKYCKVEYIFESMKDHHDNECHLIPIQCPLKCTHKLPRSMVEDHQKSCKNASVECEFQPLGCYVDLKRKEVARHMKDGAIDHVKLLKERLMLVTGYFAEKDAGLVELLKTTNPTDEDMNEDEVNEENTN